MSYLASHSSDDLSFGYNFEKIRHVCADFFFATEEKIKGKTGQKITNRGILCKVNDNQLGQLANLIYLTIIFIEDVCYADCITLRRIVGT